MKNNIHNILPSHFLKILAEVILSRNAGYLTLGILRILTLDRSKIQDTLSRSQDLYYVFKGILLHYRCFMEFGDF